MRVGTVSLSSEVSLYFVFWENWVIVILVFWRFSMMTLLLITEKLFSVVRFSS